MVDENVSGNVPAGGQPADSSVYPRTGDGGSRSGSQDHLPYEFHVQNPTPHPQLQRLHPFGPAGQQSHQSLNQAQARSGFNMSEMAGALPDYSHRPSSNVQPYDQREFQGQLNSINYPMHPSQYSTPYQEHGSAGGYGSIPGSHRSHSGGPSPIHSAFPSHYFPQQQQQFMGFPQHYGQMGQGNYAGSYAPNVHQTYGQSDNPAMGGRTQGYPAGAAMQNPYPQQAQFLRPGPAPVGSRESSGSSGGGIPSTPRGPPRKPKQSGHALWVGNLPSGTVVSDLKDHFSRDATKDIESVFLISKSNCAFVNYRSEVACAAAMTRFHDSRFQGVRLVCRLRRSPTATPSTPGVPTGPAALMPSVASNQTAFDAITQNREVSSKATEKAAAESSRSGGESKVADKYFVMKSLTVEDMELSVRNNIWATQAHNEDALNEAYKTAQTVILIFSANKSGEYFGYARMASPIDDETSAELDWAPRGETVVNDPDVPRSIPTLATDHAPKGRIIDDSARGTIFWEADLDEEDLEELEDHEALVPETAAATKTDESADEAKIAGEAQAFGKPFKVEWLSTNRLPFYRTRGLRNPWNANREVKIARDGTELETSVGRKVVQMFHRSQTDPMPQPSMDYGPSRPR